MKKKVIKAEIISNNKIAPDHFVLEVKSSYLGAYTLPGQFVNIRVNENGTDPLLRIPLGVHIIRKKSIKLLYKVIGPGTEILRNRKKGETIDVLGPLGTEFDITPLLGKKDPIAIMVSGGHGIATLYALTEELIKKKIKIEFLAGACSKKHLICIKDLKKMGAKVHLATDDGTIGHKGYVTELLVEHLKRRKTQDARLQIYGCGPELMLKKVCSITKKYKVSCQVSLDEYMACGIGACLGCAVRTVSGYKMACTDGPVFDAQEIVW